MVDIKLTKAQIAAELQKRGVDPESGQALPKPAMTKAEIKSILEARGVTLPPDNAAEEFVSGVKRGTKTTAALITEGVPALTQGLLNKGAEAFGYNAPFDVQENLEAYNDKVDNANQQNPTRFNSFRDVHSVGDGIGYIAGAVGEQVPQLIGGMGAGGAGAFAMKAGVKSLAKRAGKELTEQQVNSALAKGFIGGAAATSASQNVPESYFSLLEKGIDDPFAAVLAGGLKTGLDVIPQTRVFEKILGPYAGDAIGDSLIKKIGKEAVTQGALESGTEMAQTGIDIIADQLVNVNAGDMFSPENVDMIIDSGLKAAFGGGIMGAAATPFHSGTRGDLKPRQNTEAQKKYDTIFDESLEVMGPSKILINKDNLTDSSVTPPMYLPDEALKQADILGIDKDTMTLVAPEEIGEVHNAMQSSLDALDINDVYRTPEDQETLAKKRTALKARRKAIKEGKREDFNFVPGDGIMEVGPDTTHTVLTLPESLRKPSRKIKFTDTGNITKVTAKAKTKKPVTPKKQVKVQEAVVEASEVLPLDLQGAKPRYKNSELDFPSDEAKALYLLGNTETKSARDADYRTWLKERTGLSDADITKYANHLKKQIGRIHNNKPDSKVIKVPVVEFLDGDKVKTQRAVDPDAIYKKVGNKDEVVDYIVQNYENDPTYSMAKDARFKHLSPMELAVLKQDAENLQGNTRRYPAFGNVEDAYLFPNVMANQLVQVPLSEKAQVAYKDIVKGAERIIREIAGEGAEFRPLESIHDSLNNDPIVGAQFKNVVALVLNPTTVGNKTYTESLYHEIWHLAERAGLVNKKDKQRVMNDTIAMQEYLRKDSYLDNFIFDDLLKTEAGREEIRANAFGKWMVEMSSKDAGFLDKAQIVPDLVPAPFRKAFKDVTSFMRKFRNMLKGRGFNSFEDVFINLATGQSRAKVEQHLKDLTFHNQLIRTQRIADQVQAVRHETLNRTDQEAIEAAVKSTNAKTDKKGNIGFYGKYLMSFARAADGDEMISIAYNSFQSKIKRMNQHLTAYKDALGDYLETPKEARHKLHELADHCRRSEQKARLNEDGHLIFERDGFMVKLKDVDLSRKYMLLQEGYTAQLNDYASEILRAATNQYQDHFGDQVVTPELFKKELANIDPKKQSKMFEDFSQIVESFDSIELMRKKDYAPRIRYGSWGFSVHEKVVGANGETITKQVDLFTVENGRYNKQYNKFQLEDVMKRIRENYSDTSKYIIYGDNKKVITDLNDLSNFTPFKMSFNNLRDMVDARFLNLETLNALLQNKGLTDEEMKVLAAEVYQDTVTRGFKTRFAKSEDVGIGYSRDWDRVMHSSFSGSAHYFSAIPHKEKMAILTKEVGESLKDDALKKHIMRYIEYTSSPQDDMQMLRSFNFFWTMGANVSTAALQMYTLPTITFSKLCQFNPNMLQNAATISKYTKMAFEFTGPSVKKTMYSNDGMFYLDFGDKKVISKLINDGRLTQQQANFLLKQFNMFKASLAEDFTGFRQFETQGFDGAVKDKISKTAYFLGMPIAYTEQITRFATTMAAFETINNNPQAQHRFLKAHENNFRFQVQLESNPQDTFSENAAAYLMDDIHAVFGKHGRAPVFRSLGGALFVPFATYQHQMLEGMVRMYQSGPDGKRALAIQLGVMMFFAGLMGLPGAELIKELGELIENQLTGTEEDFDLLIREAVYGVTKSETAGKFATQGIGRAFFNLDVSKRLGLGIPGTDIILALTGARKADATDTLGVSGSLISGMAEAWNQYNNDGSVASILSAVAPSSVGNLTKAMQMQTTGVSSKGGDKLLLEDEIKMSTKLYRVLGISSDQVASRREEMYYGKILPQTKFKVGTDRFRARAKKHLTDYYEYTEENKESKARKALDEWKKAIKDYQDFCIENNVPVDMPSFNRSVMSAVQQRTTAEVDMKLIRKHSRADFYNKQLVLGTARD